MEAPNRVFFCRLPLTKKNNLQNVDKEQAAYGKPRLKENQMN
jgi:hypothetical protein